MKTYFRRTFTLGLIPVLLLTSIACVKRVSIPPETREIESYRDKIYVYLRPGKEYKGKSVLTVKNPDIGSDFLVGRVPKGSVTAEIRIPLSDIAKIEILQVDKKKTIRNTIIGVLIFAAVTVFFVAYSPIHLGSVD